MRKMLTKIFCTSYRSIHVLWLIWCERQEYFHNRHLSESCVFMIKHLITKMWRIAVYFMSGRGRGGASAEERRSLSNAPADRVGRHLCRQQDIVSHCWLQTLISRRPSGANSKVQGMLMICLWGDLWINFESERETFGALGGGERTLGLELIPCNVM